MCGRFGSTFTVCDWPTCVVRPISLGLVGSVTSMISSPPWGTFEAPSTPWSWQRPGASVASTMSWASRRSANGFATFRMTSPFGAASGSCWRPVIPVAALRHEAEGWPVT